MKTTARKAVSPIIATLLLIAIAVAAGIIVYVYVNSLAGGLTQGGGQQVADQLSMDAYNYATIASGPTVTIRDTGSSSVTITGIFFDGTSVTTLAAAPGGTCSSPSATTPFGTCSTGQTLTFNINTNGATTEASGTSHSIKILDSTGGTEVITIVAGRTG
jgi:archaeal type IV pilus assembly protein PilA